MLVMVSERTKGIILLGIGVYLFFMLLVIHDTMYFAVFGWAQLDDSDYCTTQENPADCRRLIDEGWNRFTGSAWMLNVGGGVVIALLYWGVTKTLPDFRRLIMKAKTDA
jgi:hypothetical protein